MRRLRRATVLCLGLTVVVALLLSGCGAKKEQPQAGPTEKPVRIAMFILVRANAYDQARIDGVNSNTTAPAIHPYAR